MYNATMFINKMMEYYKVHTISELAGLIKIGQPAISKWKNNNSINSIKKKCRELGIYKEIFNEYDIYEFNNSTKYVFDYMDMTDKQIEKKNKYIRPFLDMEALLYKKRNDLKNLKIDTDVIDTATFFLFSEAYFGALSILHLKEFRIHLINFTFADELDFNEIENENFNSDEKNSNLISLIINKKIVDAPTFFLFLEAYKKAKKNNILKEFRTHLMEYDFNDLDS